MQVLEQFVVVFSQNYLPLCRVNIKRAIVLLVTSKAEGLSFATQNRWRVHSPGLVIDVAKHIRLKIASSEQMWKVLPVNWREVSRPDHHSCQYCGSGKHLTLDHVIGRSQGSSHTGDNVVTAGERCNSPKGDRIPFEAGMQLRKTPKAPVHPTISFVVSKAWRNSATEFWIDVQANLE
ncbi:HNH endonuclease [Nostoc sp. CENA67]|uniref:HNH endonuclease n=1 Tax=Amazonocrinis nigriterrae CENA67 TaxID=2794033 RepID=A0A8J7HQZ3_9NOST|nr:HNH endonuclease [Amazonocrinis nigriterrae]MBH8560859.1 HNH endonuclease [Amazonocrinis nigriterrae CENA67]